MQPVSVWRVKINVTAENPSFRGDRNGWIKSVVNLLSQRCQFLSRRAGPISVGWGGTAKIGHARSPDQASGFRSAAKAFIFRRSSGQLDSQRSAESCSVAPLGLSISKRIVVPTAAASPTQANLGYGTTFNVVTQGRQMPPMASSPKSILTRLIHWQRRAASMAR